MPVPVRIATAWALLEAEMILEETRRKAQASPDNKKEKKPPPHPKETEVSYPPCPLD
ncbi:MAG: hypothetical protein J5I98_14790 [Phaeodactylibacter sp.]|nr:hypothetical protein [Phaeodactylibacter sp.]